MVFRGHLILVLILLVVACAQPAENLDAADTDIDLVRGELIALSCQACHSFGAGEEHLLGPNLYKLFGRPVASAPDFEYSAVLREAEFIWTLDELDSWLSKPEEFLPGNNMVFAGFDSESDRNDLLAYLAQATSEGIP
jgi:cytochrome c